MTTPTPRTDAFATEKQYHVPRLESEWLEYCRQLERELSEVKQELENLRRENNIIKTILSKAQIPCIYCGLDDMSKCKSGFPGCAKADDLICGEDEVFKRVCEERDQLRAELEQVRKELNERKS